MFRPEIVRIGSDNRSSPLLAPPMMEECGYCGYEDEKPCTALGQYI